MSAGQPLPDALLPLSHIGVEQWLLVIAAPNHPVIRIDARLLDRIDVEVEPDLGGGSLILAVEELDVGVYIVEGFEAAKSIADQLAPYTRYAPITRLDVYEDAKRRMLRLRSGSEIADKQTPAEDGLRIGSGVSLRGEYLHVGEVAFTYSEVKHYADNSADLPLPNGRMQAAVAILLVTAEQRAARGEDLALLARRIAAYETRQLDGR